MWKELDIERELSEGSAKGDEDQIIMWETSYSLLNQLMAKLSLPVLPDNTDLWQVT